MNILFIARRFPPSVGGMERFAYDLAESLQSKTSKMRLITWGGSNKWLPIVLPWLTLRSFWLLVTDRSIEIIHIQDASLSPIGWLLHKLSGKPYVVVAHGLDIMFKNPLYQKVIPWCLKRSSAVISISHATDDEVIKRGVNKSKTHTIPLGIIDDTHQIKPDKKLLAKKLSIKNLENKKILITVGRLVKRKGVAWFIENVMPEISKKGDVIYLIAGDGAEKLTIQTAIENKKLNKQVRMIGKVNEETKNLLYRSADIFVMPNIKVDGDMEGFGRVAHEAAVAGLPVIAGDLEGIKEAITNHQNGILVKSGDKKDFIDELNKMLKSAHDRNAFGTKARNFTLGNYNWDAVSMKYIDVYNKII